MCVCRGMDLNRRLSGAPNLSARPPLGEDNGILYVSIYTYQRVFYGRPWGAVRRWRAHVCVCRGMDLNRRLSGAPNVSARPPLGEDNGILYVSIYTYQRVFYGRPWGAVRRWRAHVCVCRGMDLNRRLSGAPNVSAVPPLGEDNGILYVSIYTYQRVFLRTPVGCGKAVARACVCVCRGMDLNRRLSGAPNLSAVPPLGGEYGILYVSIYTYQRVFYGRLWGAVRRWRAHVCVCVCRGMDLNRRLSGAPNLSAGPPLGGE